MSPPRKVAAKSKPSSPSSKAQRKEVEVEEEGETVEVLLGYGRFYLGKNVHGGVVYSNDREGRGWIGEFSVLKICMRRGSISF